MVIHESMGSIDRWTSIDEKLGGLNDIAEEAVAVLTQDIVPAVTDGNRNQYHLEFSTEVPADTVDEPLAVERTVPFDGHITMFYVGWPDGAQNGAGIGLARNEGERLFPRNQEDKFVAFNDVSYDFGLRAPVEHGEDLIVEFTNADTNESHFLNAVVEIQEAV